MITKIHLTLATEITFTAEDGGIEGDTIAHLKSFDIATHRFHYARRFMPHNNEWLTTAGTSIHTLNIATTNGAGHNPHQEIARATIWFGHLFIDELVILFE